MKLTFPLEDSKRKPAQVVDSIKNKVRKYLKRERRKKRPEEVDFWDFDCRIGKTADSAEDLHVEEIIEMIDVASAQEWDEVYVEILAKPGVRKKKPGKAEDEQSEED